VESVLECASHQLLKTGVESLIGGCEESMEAAARAREKRVHFAVRSLCRITASLCC